MPLKIMCPICTEDFVESEEIYSTSCGHIYHLDCMRQWQSRATSCPQCREHNPSTHKLYLIISEEETPSAPAEDHEDLRTKLESSVDKIHELQAQVQQSELNFMHLQEQYTVEQEMRKRFEQRVAEINDNDENFLHLHGQYSESEEQRKFLQDENERLTIENQYNSEELVLKASEISALKESLSAVLIEQSGECESDLLRLNAQFSESEDRLKALQQENIRLVTDSKYKSKEIELKTKEISSLREFQNKKKSETSDLAMNTKVSTLEQKLKHITGELEKEIANSTQLAIDKFKLQSHIQRMELQDNAPRNAKREEAARPKRFSFENNPNIANIPYSLSSPNIHRNKQQSKASVNSVILQKFPYKEIRYPLEDVIVTIAAKMDVSISKEDIVKANIMDRNIPITIPKDVCVYVEFKSDDLRMRFLSKKHLLRKDETFKFVVLKEYIDQQLHGVFLYANRKLRGVVFEHIACRNNTIMAKKKQHDVEGIIIQSREQVDELLKKSVQSTNVTTSPQAGDVIDESYYKI